MILWPRDSYKMPCPACIHTSQSRGIPRFACVQLRSMWCIQMAHCSGPDHAGEILAQRFSRLAFRIKRQRRGQGNLLFLAFPCFSPCPWTVHPLSLRDAPESAVSHCAVSPLLSYTVSHSYLGPLCVDE